jgi:archaellum component FlaG (FlaF/FlaG flagellin family)
MKKRQTSTHPVKAAQTPLRFVLCIKNEGYEASLEKRKVYRVLADRSARAHNLIRVVDESGEDYLYPSEWFFPITLSRTIVKAIAS